MDTQRGAQVWRDMKEKEGNVYNSNLVKLLQHRIKELETELRITKKLLYEK